MDTLPYEIRQKWLASLKREPIEAGHYYLEIIEPTKRGSNEEQRLIVEVVDENGIPVRVPVAFAYSTAPLYIIEDGFKWTPPYNRMDVYYTRGGMIEHIQGSGVKEGEPGGVTVYLLDKNFSSDVVSGLGMLADHTGLYLRFRLQRQGVKSFQEQLDAK